MAKQEVGLKIDVDVKSVGNMKQELRAATQELIAVNEKFGSTSKQAVEAAKRVASLKDAIGDAKALADTFNPDKKFVALGGAVQGAVAGFSALQGAIGLFGSESKEVEKILLKVQSAMALQQGISGIAGAADSFKLLSGQIATSNIVMKANAAATTLTSGVMRALGISVNTTSTSFKVLRTAIISTGIGALVVAIGFAVEALMNLADSSDEAEKAQKKLEKAERDAAAAIEMQNKMLQDQISLADRNTQVAIKRAQAAGKSEAEITNITKDGILKRKKLLEDDLANRGTGDAQYFKKLEDLRKVNNELEDFDLDQQIKRTQELQRIREDQSKKAEDKRKKDKEKRKQDAEDEKKRQEEIQKNTEENLKNNAKRAKDLENQLRLARITDEKERSKVETQIKLQDELDAETERFKNGEVRLEQYLINLGLIRQRYAAEDKARQEKDTQEGLKKESDQLLKDAENKDLSFQERIAKIQERQALEKQIVFASEEERKAFIAENEKAITDIKLLEGQARVANAQFAADQLSAIAQIVGQDTAAGKALSIAAATISTYLSAQKAYESQFKPLAIVDSPVRGAIAAGVAVATGIANIRKIMAVQVPARGGGGAGGGAGISTSAPVAPQLAPQVMATQVNTAAVNQMGNRAARAYVLNSDIQNEQQRNAYIDRNASIGNP